jgi:hypothetical protein
MDRQRDYVVNVDDYFEEDRSYDNYWLHNIKNNPATDKEGNSVPQCSMAYNRMKTLTIKVNKLERKIEEMEAISKNNKTVIESIQRITWGVVATAMSVLTATLINFVIG